MTEHRCALYSIRWYASVVCRWLAILIVLTACGGKRGTEPRITNVEPPRGDAGIDAQPCPNPCMDTCCELDQVCSHGRAGDGTYAKCLRR